MKVLVTQLYRSICDLMDCSLPGCSNHGNSPGKNTGVYHTHTHTLPPTDNQGTKVFIDRERGYIADKSTVSSNTHLEIGHQSSDQHPPDYFRYS